MLGRFIISLCSRVIQIFRDKVIVPCHSDGRAYAREFVQMSTSYKTSFRKRNYRCSNPITSYGIIAYHLPRVNEIKSSTSTPDVSGDGNDHPAPLYLLYRRRDSFSYIDFIRGMWKNVSQIHFMFDHMTFAELERIYHHPFDDLWRDLWVNPECAIYRGGYIQSRNAYESIYYKTGFSLKTLLKPYLDRGYGINPEWCFPKGKKSHKDEDDIVCATREFTEETRIECDQHFTLKDDTYIEDFDGTNGKPYRTIFYVAEIDEIKTPPVVQTPKCIRKQTISEETDALEWLTLEQCLERLSDQRQDILRQVDFMVRARARREVSLAPFILQDIMVSNSETASPTESDEEPQEKKDEPDVQERGEEDDSDPVLESISHFSRFMTECGRVVTV